MNIDSSFCKSASSIKDIEASYSPFCWRRLAKLTKAIKLENNAIAVENRQKEYGSIASQIEFITEKGLEAWKTNVQSIKTKYPKESE